VRDLFLGPPRAMDEGGVVARPFFSPERVVTKRKAGLHGMGEAPDSERYRRRPSFSFFSRMPIEPTEVRSGGQHLRPPEPLLPAKVVRATMRRLDDPPSLFCSYVCLPS